jgi:uncharacterized protein (DUF2147 family)
MYRRVVPVAAALGAILALTAVRLDAEPLPQASILGNYRVPGSEMILAIAECSEGQLCGRVVGLGKLPELLPCEGCQAAASEPRERLCGVAVMTDLHRTDSGWEAKYDDPALGIEYTLNLWRPKNIAADTTLLTQRHNAPPFLTRSMPRVETWTRVAAPAAPCGTATPTS